MSRHGGNRDGYDCEDCEHYLTPWKCNGGTEESPCPLSLDAANLPASDAEPASDDSNAAREVIPDRPVVHDAQHYTLDDAVSALTDFDGRVVTDADLLAYIHRLEAENARLLFRERKLNETLLEMKDERDRYKRRAEEATR